MKEKSNARQDSSQPCVICKEDFGLQQQVSRLDQYGCTGIQSSVFCSVFILLFKIVKVDIMNYLLTSLVIKETI